MSKVEHYDKIWSRAANQKYRDNWERTFGKKTKPRPALSKTMKAVGAYLERQKDAP